MMEHALVSVATGVLSPLLGKLSSLVEKEYSELKGVRKETISLQDELRSMKALLERLAAEDEPDALVREWRNQIRDLSYDIEDCVDDFLLREEHGHGGSKQPDVGFFRKNFFKLRELGARRDIAETIRHLKARVDNVSKRRDRYKLDGASSSSIPATYAASVVAPIDTRLPALYPTAGSLVGIDGPREEIVKLLSEGEGDLRKSFKVVSIVGFGGLGKTTLAYEVYRKLGKHFDCKMNVSVSQSPDIAKIFTNILLQAGQPGSHICSGQQELTDQLRSYLLDKRYFIIFDDIWNEYVWDAIRCALPENDNGSRVITTTRVESVASACCAYHHDWIYKMNPLNGQDSRKLFFGRIFGSEDACPSELKEVSSQILRKCGGLPLAIKTIAALFATQATKEKEYWEYVQNSLGSTVGPDHRMEVMRQILNLSYKDLSPHLKTCFLYLGAYQEDTMVWRDDLVRQWVAESFVGGMQGDAVNCFHELVNRNMIQPVMFGYNGEVLSCRVHDMMLDLIIRKNSKEENFMTVVETSSQSIRFKVRESTHKVRRLFHHSSEERRRHLLRWVPAMDFDLSKVRSFSACGSSTPGHIPPLSQFRFIRVLILEFILPSEATGAETVDLTAISKLFQLRYLKIRSEVKLQLPSHIRGLQNLETLEIVASVSPSLRRHTSIALPSDVAQLPRLSYLSILPQMASLPDGIGAMRSLRSLAFFVLEEKSLDTIRGIQHLTSLGELYVRVPLDESFERTADARVDVLCSSLPQQHGDHYCKLYLHAMSPEAWFEIVPRWISRLEKLYSLELGVGQLCREGVAVLAGLPALVRLDLSILGVDGVPIESTIVTGDGFPELKHLIITCRTLCLAFQPGAMPSLQKLNLEFNVDAAASSQPGGSGNVITGVEHLSGLKNIIARIGGFGDSNNTEDSSRRAAAVSALRDAIGTLPSSVELDIMCVQGRYGHA